ncbi:MAG: hypothetical protein DCF25_16590 [Leptolyngbya foveolarum]|uniref:DUF3370 domain-containing protein n=1 Tax=Leptolyngbya foveolarum TaxID=47253 RepID=A0A2W4VLG7_9CYAN|nr:MAG: hypothetical protein DCF25_16590 [Leptolyngbya foveolarum]
MLVWLTTLLMTPQVLASQGVAQAPDGTPTEIVIEQPVRPLPGELDNVPVFNSNSPELVAEPGILLSTFPPAGMSAPEAHLNFPFNGRFDVFAHHVYKALDYDAEVPELLDSLYIGVLMHNPSAEPVTVRVLTGASYLSQPDAPFVPLPSFVPFSVLRPVFAGPGSRAMGDILQGRRQNIFPAVITIAPGESELLMNQPIPIRALAQPINGRSTLVKLESSGPVYVASLSQFVGLDENGEESPPSLASWEQILREGSLAGPRDRIPTPLPIKANEPLIYGRVAGVSRGSQWQTTLTDNNASDLLTIPAVGEAFSYGISLLVGGKMGTGQIQSAPMIVRYPDTAYQAHGNYGVRYSLTLPLHNSTEEPQRVSVALQTAIKEDELSAGGLRFFAEEAPQTFFRGPVQVRYRSDEGFPQIRNIHLVQKRGQQSDALATVMLAPQETRTVQVDLLYPADSTPPQVLTVQTLTSL